MTREDPVDWLKANDCEQVPLEGINISGRAIKFINRKTKKHTYIDTPIDDRQIPEYIVAHVCEQLLIHSPDCVAEQKPIVKKIRERFTANISKKK